jgi:hypothetical protein
MGATQKAAPDAVGLRGLRCRSLDEGVEGRVPRSTRVEHSVWAARGTVNATARMGGMRLVHRMKPYMLSSVPAGHAMLDVTV